MLLQVTLSKTKKFKTINPTGMNNIEVSPFCILGKRLITFLISMLLNGPHKPAIKLKNTKDDTATLNLDRKYHIKRKIVFGNSVQLFITTLLPRIFHH